MRATVVVLVTGLVLGSCAQSPSVRYERHYRRGEQAYGAGDWPAAVEEFRAAVEVRPGSAEAWNALGRALLEAGDRDGAIDAFGAAVRLRPAFAEARNNLGVALLDGRDVAGAVAQFREAVAARPAYAPARYNLCLGLELLDRFAEALRECQAAQRLAPATPGLASTISRLEEKLSRE